MSPAVIDAELKGKVVKNTSSASSPRPKKKSARQKRFAGLALVVRGLLDANITKAEIARQTGLSMTAVKTYAKRFQNDELASQPVNRQVVATVQKTVSNMFIEKSQDILQSIDKETINKAGLRDRAVSSAILYDKHRLASGQATQQVSVVHALLDRGLAQDVSD